MSYLLCSWSQDICVCRLSRSVNLKVYCITEPLWLQTDTCLFFFVSPKLAWLQGFGDVIISTFKPPTNCKQMKRRWRGRALLFCSITSMWVSENWIRSWQALIRLKVSLGEKSAKACLKDNSGLLQHGSYFGSHDNMLTKLLRYVNTEILLQQSFFSGQETWAIRQGVNRFCDVPRSQINFVSTYLIIIIKQYWWPKLQK